MNAVFSFEKLLSKKIDLKQPFRLSSLTKQLRRSKRKRKVRPKAKLHQKAIMKEDLSPMKPMPNLTKPLKVSLNLQQFPVSKRLAMPTSTASKERDDFPLMDDFPRLPFGRLPDPSSPNIIDYRKEMETRFIDIEKDSLLGGFRL